MTVLSLLLFLLLTGALGAAGWAIYHLFQALMAEKDRVVNMSLHHASQTMATAERLSSSTPEQVREILVTTREAQESYAKNMERLVQTAWNPGGPDTPPQTPPNLAAVYPFPTMIGSDEAHPETAVDPTDHLISPPAAYRPEGIVADADLGSNPYGIEGLVFNDPLAKLQSVQQGGV